MGEGGMTLMFMGAGWVLFVALLYALVLAAWIFIGVIYRLVIKVSRPPRAMGSAIALLLLVLTAMPPFMAKRYYDKSMADFNKTLAQLEPRPETPTAP